MDGCGIKRCRGGADLIYLGHGVCEKHWDRLMADDVPHDALRVALGIEAAPDAAMEEQVMDDAKSTRKAEASTDAPVKSKGSKKPVKAAPKETKAAKEPRPKREKVDNPVVFAFRLSEADRTKIHYAAGGGKASGFVLAAALAAANGDTKAFEAVVASRATK